MNKIASVLAFSIGAMAVFAGGQVLLGKAPGYYVIDWLPVYNYTIGILTVFVTAILIWISHKLAMPLAFATFVIHALVMLILQTAYRGVAALESVAAMTIRITTWLIVLALMFLQSRKNKATKNKLRSRMGYGQ